MTKNMWIKETAVTENYICSVLNTNEGWDYINQIKEDVKGSSKRIRLRGRLGKNNPNARKYIGNTQDIKLSDAAWIDVYLRKR